MIPLVTPPPPLLVSPTLLLNVEGSRFKQISETDFLLLWAQEKQPHTIQKGKKKNSIDSQPTAYLALCFQPTAKTDALLQFGHVWTRAETTATLFPFSLAT